jgi:hypothetical protein
MQITLMVDNSMVNHAYKIENIISGNALDLGEQEYIIRIGLSRCGLEKVFSTRYVHFQSPVSEVELVTPKSIEEKDRRS